MATPLRLILPRISERDFYEQHLVGTRARPGLLTVFGWRWFHCHDSRHSPAGFPDLVLVRPAEAGGRGRLIFAELKRDGEQPTAVQRAWLDDLGALPGVEAYVWRPEDLETIAEVLR